MAAIYLRQAKKADLPEIINIIHDAKRHLKEQGIDQWQTGYPTDADLERDVEYDIMYVLVVDGKIAGTAALWMGIDPNYLKIEDGEWAGGPEARYTAIHRIAVSGNYRGQHLSDKLISGLLTVSRQLGYRDVRIDTHPDNKGMQHVINKNGFTYRGIIYMLTPPSPRYAYQITLD